MKILGALKKLGNKQKTSGKKEVIAKNTALETQGFKNLFKQLAQISLRLYLKAA